MPAPTQPPQLGQQLPRTPVTQSLAWLVGWVGAGAAWIVVLFATIRDLVPAEFGDDARELFVFGLVSIGMTRILIGLMPRFCSRLQAMQLEGTPPGEEPVPFPRAAKLILGVGFIGTPVLASAVSIAWAYLMD